MMNSILNFLLIREVFLIVVAIVGVFIASAIKLIMRSVFKKKGREFCPKKYEYIYAGIAFSIEVLTFVLMSIYYYQITTWNILIRDGFVYGLSTSGIYMIIQATRKIGKMSWRQLVALLSKIGIVFANWYSLYKQKKLTSSAIQEGKQDIKNTLDGMTEAQANAFVIDKAAKLLGINKDLLIQISKNIKK